MRFCLVVVFACALGSAEDPALRADLQRFNEHFVQQWNAKNYQGVANLYTPGAVLQLAGFPPIIGTDDIATSVKQTIDAGMTEISLLALEAYFVQDDAGSGRAVGFQRGNYTFKDSDGKQVDAGNFLTVMMKTSRSNPWQAFIDTPTSAMAPSQARARARSHQVGRGALKPLGASPLQMAIDARDQMWCNFVKARNFTAVADLYSHNATVLAQHLPAVHGRLAIATVFAKALAPVATVTLNSITSGVDIGDEYAYERGAYTFYGSSNNVLDVGKYATIWHRNGNDWELYVDTFNSNKNM